MEDLSRSEYPAMLASLAPNQAVHVLSERVRRIGKLNQEIADWLQERRKVEEQYAAGLRKLMLLKVPNRASDFGVFQPTWDGILRSVETIADSHQTFSQRIEKDVEGPLRAFQTRKEMTNMATMSGNLQGMSKELEEAQDRSDKLYKKAGKASAQKVDFASSKLETATQQWDSQSPFIFESLQAFDEQRVNQLRDLLTQLETHEVDQATRTQAAAEAMLNLILEIKTEDEVKQLVQRVMDGRPKVEKRSNTRQSSIVGSVSGRQSIVGSVSGRPQSSHTANVPVRESMPPPPPPPPQPHSSFNHDDSASERSRNETPQTESKLRSRIGTMLGRRRQSVHGGFGPLSPSKGANASSFNRGSIGSSHGRSVSPRGSSYNLNEAHSRLSSLAETPDSPQPPRTADARTTTPREGTTNGVHDQPAIPTRPGTNSSHPATTFDDIFNVPPPSGPPPSQQRAVAETPSAATTDADGYTVPPQMNDPISLAQRDAAAASGAVEEGDQAFKVNIKNEPVAEEDAAAKRAAMSSVANTLSQAMPSRRGGTVRGRRDVRNTIFVPSPTLPEGPSFTSQALPRTPTFSSTASRPSAVAALASEASTTGTSDTQSVRSATSLGGIANFKHPDMTGPGLNSSIIETVSAEFEDGELKSTKIAGEIAFSYNASNGTAKESEVIRINNFSLLEAIGPNRIFVQSAPAADEFVLNTTHLQHKPTVGFTFRAHSENATSLAAHCPLAIKPVWKPTGDKLGLLLQYRLNPYARLAQPVTLHNVIFIATYEGARASGAQTKPSGTHLKDKHLVYWRVGDVTLTEAWTKIICRIVGDQGGEPKPGHIEARWEYATTESAASSAGTGITISQLLSSDSNGKGKDPEDPFADESVASPRSTAGSWGDVPLVRQIVSGRYEAK